MQAKPLLLQKSGPFVVVALQECARMNALLGEIRRSLGELDKGTTHFPHLHPVTDSSHVPTLHPVNCAG